MTWIKYALFFNTAFTTFVLGLLSVFLWLSIVNDAEKPLLCVRQSLPNDLRASVKPVNYELPDLSFCELVKNPEAYTGKIIRLKGIYTYNDHGAFITGDCFSSETMTWVKMTDRQSEEIENLALKPNELKNWRAIEIVAVGKFEQNTPPAGQSGTIAIPNTTQYQAPYRFELIKTEKARLLSNK